MRLIVTLYRIAVFPTVQLTANLRNFGPNSNIEEAIQARFGTLAPRFKIFQNAMGRKSWAGMEVMTFDLQVEDAPQAGLIMADPLDPKEVDRIDGALRSELERLGIQSQVEEYEWRMNYVKKGN